MAKATMATVKLFIRKNAGNLFITTHSKFDGMVDCVMPCEDSQFHPVKYAIDVGGYCAERTLGIQWNPLASDSDEARKIVVYLEDRRVLFNPLHMEDSQHCLNSIIDIRKHVTEILARLSQNSNIAKPLRRMRKSSQDFCNVVGHPKFNSFELPVKSSLLERELFKLRKNFGLSLAELSVAYGLDVDDQLASIIPFNNAENV